MIGAIPAAGAELAGDLIRGEAGAGGEGHMDERCRILRHRLLEFFFEELVRTSFATSAPLGLDLPQLNASDLS